MAVPHNLILPKDTKTFMNKKKIAAAIAAVSTVTLSAMPVMAEVVRRDADNNIYVAGLGNSQIEIQLQSAGVRTRNVEADRCGTIRITPALAYSAATKISVGGVESNIAELPTATPGRCALVNGAYASVSQPAATRYKDAIGAIYIQGLTAKSDQVVSYPDLPMTRMATPNACGYVRLASPQDAPFTNTTTIKINSQSYTLGNLSSVTAPSCRRIDDTHSKMMVPLEEADMWTSSN